MAAHQAKAKQLKARTPAAASNAKNGKSKAAHKSAPPPKKKPAHASKPVAKKNQAAAKKAHPAVNTKPTAKTQAKHPPKSETKSHAADKAGVQTKEKTAKQAAAAAAASAKLIAKQIAKQQAVKLSAKQKQDLKNRTEQKPEDAEARRTRLKNLIKLGKERGFLTYSEINDHLPDDLVDAEQIESIITTFSDMGIQVYDVAPDAETLLISENAPAVVPDEDAEEEAEAALSTVDPEFGRTTDPVRMYMREIVSVELLTREGEI